jgi:hypothetical protein
LSANPNTVPPYVFEQKGTFPAPFTYPVPASLEVRPDTATARFDGSGASGNFLACLTFYGTDGERLGRWFNPTVLAPGDVAEVTYTPPFGSAATNAAPSGSGWMFDTDPQAGDWGVLSVTEDDPTGYTGGPFSGQTFAFRIDASEFAGGGICFINLQSLTSSYSYLQLHGPRATIEATGSGSIVEIQTFSQGPISLGGQIIEMQNIPTSNAGLSAGDVYRAGAGPDSALMVK